MWTGVLNHPSPGELDALLSLPLEELVIGQEKAPSTGTEHIHVYMKFNQRKRLTQLKAISERMHWEPVRDRAACIAYCVKDGDVLVQRLSRPMKSANLTESLEELKHLGLAGYADKYPSHFVRYQRGLQALALHQLDGLAKPPPQVEWYWGPTGTGKSRMAIGDEVNQDNIFIQRGPNSKGACMWWDGYTGQRTVVLDDFRPWWCPFSFLLGLLDRYPIRVQVKGGFVNFVPEKIIVTTPLNIQDTFQEFRSQEDIAQVRRRVHRVVEFKTLGGASPPSPLL